MLNEHYIGAVKLSYFTKRTHIEIKVSTLVAFLAIFTFGFYSWGPNYDLSSSIFSTRNLFALSFLFIEFISIVLLSKYTNESTARIRINFGDIGISLLTATIFFAINPQFVYLRLVGDELFHAQSAVAHGTKILISIEKILSHFKISVLSNTEYRHLLSVTQIFVLIIFILCTKVFLKSNSTLGRITFFFFILFVSTSFVGFGYKYPSGYILPQFLISGLFITTLGFRFVQIFVFVLIFAISTQRIFSARSRTRQLFLYLTILQIPIVAFGATQIEQSVYFAIFAGLILYKLSILKGSANNESLFALVAFLILCRIPALILLPMIIVIVCRKNGVRFRDWAVSPFAVVLPLIFISLSEAIISFAGRNSNSEISAYTNQASKVVALWRSVQSEFDYLSLVLLGLSIIYLLTSSHSRIITLSYFALSSVVYSVQIPNSVVGHNKYAFEIFTPVIIFALLKSSDYFGGSGNKFNNAFSYPIILVLALSILSTNHKSDLEKSLDNWKQIKRMINYPVSVDIEKVLLSRQRQDKCLNLGTTYGNFNYVLSGISLAKLNELNRSQLPDIDSLNWGKGLRSDLNLNSYNCLVLDAYPLKSQIRKLLQDQGFMVTYQQSGPFYGTLTQIWEKELVQK